MSYVMVPYLWLAVMVTTGGLNFWIWRRNRRGTNLIAAIVASICAIPWALVIAANLSAGCGPWAPAEVEYHDGMTICPGQSARGSFQIEAPNKSAPEERKL